MRNSKELAAWFEEILTPLGFQRKQSAWYLNCDETVLVIGLQKSDFGGQYFVNLGVSVKALESEAFPAPNLCQIVCRLNKLVPKNIAISDALNLEMNMDKGERCRIITQSLTEYGLPFLRSCDTRSQISFLLQHNGLDHAGVWKTVYELCELQSP